MIVDWLRSTAEWRNWGWNALIVCFFATLVFNAFQAWGLIRQIRTIRRTRSAASVSMPFFAYQTAVFFSFAVYSASIGTLGGVLNGALGPLYLGVVLAIRSVRPLARKERAMLCLLPCVIAAIAVLPWKDALLTMILAGSLLPMLHQAWTMWRNKSAGAVEPRYLAVFFASSAFWAVYAFQVDSLAMRLINPPASALILLTLLLWAKYRPRPA